MLHWKGQKVVESKERKIEDEIITLQSSIYKLVKICMQDTIISMCFTFYFRFKSNLGELDIKVEFDLELLQSAALSSIDIVFSY